MVFIMATAKNNDTDFLGTVIRKPSKNTFKLRLIGDSSLIVHRWSEKAKTEMYEKQQKQAKIGKDIRYPWIEFANSLYWLSEKPDLTGLTDAQARKILEEIIPKSTFGFPATAFKDAALDAGFQQGMLKKAAGTNDLAKTTARGAMFILEEYAVIEGIPTIREDMVRIGGQSKTPDFRWRAEFKNWSTTLTIIHNKNSLSVEQIVNLFDLAGFSNGVGEWRPSRDGNHGTFHVAVD